MVMSANHPLAQLLAYDRRGRAHVVSLSGETDQREYWRAIAFEVGGTCLLMDEHDVVELLPVPQITVAPGTKRWVAGIANVRGQLLLLVDFSDFLFGKPIQLDRYARVLVMSVGDVQSGLVVNRVMGIQQLPVAERRAVSADELQGNLKTVVSASYELDDRFYVLNTRSLLDDSGFMRASA